MPGDSNRDGRFDSADLVAVFQAGEYEDAIAGNSEWAEGDWNGDGDFNTADLVFAFQAGTYQATAVANSANSNQTNTVLSESRTVPFVDNDQSDRKELRVRKWLQQLDAVFEHPTSTTKTSPCGLAAKNLSRNSVFLVSQKYVTNVTSLGTRNDRDL
ncbi:MAG: hypothetical protein R3C28_22805 [Pirellulaceae bacterium]